MSFNVLQTRIGRKNLTKKILADAPAAFFGYDIVEFEGKDIREKPLAERRAILEALLQQVNHPNFVQSPTVEFSSWEELGEKRKLSRSLQSEGLMLKKKSSTYEVGRKKGHWWKWKVDPYSIDAVLIYAQAGHGRRANLYTDYTFALWQGDLLVPFAKAYSGLTDKEIEAVDAIVKKTTKEKFGPVRSVTPTLVFELGFEGINISTRHKSGIAVRFPRILRWRQDKQVEDANTLDDLKALITAP
jgi:DNA ligase-1